MTEQLRAYCDRGAMGTEMGTPIRFIAATEGIKRDGLNLKMIGARLENYRRNPVMLWCHDYWSKPPIGRVSVEVEGDRLMADVTFDQSDPFAVAIEQKYRAGFLHAVSIGWETKVMNGRDVEEWEMLDLSAVPVPGDPDALKERGKREITQLKSELDSLLSEPEAPDADETGEWQQAARRMVRVFVEPVADEAARKAEWAAASKIYRKLGRTGPEWVAEAVLTALDDEAIRGLFLENEVEVCADLFDHKRAGAVLSKANLADLEQAMTLIQGVIARAAKETETPEERAAPVELELPVTEARGAEPAEADVSPLYRIHTSLAKVLT